MFILKNRDSSSPNKLEARPSQSGIASNPFEGDVFIITRLSLVQFRVCSGQFLRSEVHSSKVTRPGMRQV